MSGSSGNATQERVARASSGNGSARPFRDGPTSLQQRRADLARLKHTIKQSANRIADVISADFGGRSHHESLLAEVLTVCTSIRHASRHLRQWMRPKRVIMAICPFERSRTIIRAWHTTGPCARSSPGLSSTASATSSYRALPCRCLYQGAEGVGARRSNRKAARCRQTDSQAAPGRDPYAVRLADRRPGSRHQPGRTRCAGPSMS